MGDVKLATPRFRFLREGYDPVEVQSTNADLVLWDMTRPRQKWPTMKDAPFLAQTFIAWAAARRTGAIPTELKWETFLESVLECTELDDDEDEDDPAGRPTPPGPGPG